MIILNRGTTNQCTWPLGFSGLHHCYVDFTVLLCKWSAPRGGGGIFAHTILAGILPSTFWEAAYVKEILVVECKMKDVSLSEPQWAFEISKTYKICTDSLCHTYSIYIYLYTHTHTHTRRKRSSSVMYPKIDSKIDSTMCTMCTFYSSVARHAHNCLVVTSDNNLVIFLLSMAAIISMQQCFVAQIYPAVVTM